MGMYTALRVKVTVKEKYRDMIQEINQGKGWGRFKKEFPFLTTYAKKERAEFIPHGRVFNIGDGWETGEYPDIIAADGFEKSIDMDTGYWTFQCSLKNYNREIDTFFKEVLSEIIESSDHIECRYEEWEESIFYKYSDGEILEYDKLSKI